MWMLSLYPTGMLLSCFVVLLANDENQSILKKLMCTTHENKRVGERTLAVSLVLTLWPRFLNLSASFNLTSLHPFLLRTMLQSASLKGNLLFITLCEGMQDRKEEGKTKVSVATRLKNSASLSEKHILS